MKIQDIKPGVFYRQKFDETKPEESSHRGETRYIYLFEKLISNKPGVGYSARGLFISRRFDQFEEVFIMNKKDHKYHLYNDDRVSLMTKDDYDFIKNNMKEILPFLFEF